MSLYEIGHGQKVKFWAIEVRKEAVFTQTGRAGARGRSDYLLLESEEAAAKHADARIRDKMQAGFVVTGAPHRFGDAFPGDKLTQVVRSGMEPDAALRHMKKVILGAAPADVSELVKAFVVAAKPRLRCLQHMWLYGFDDADGLQFRLARQYRPLGVSDNLDNYKEIGCRAQVEADEESCYSEGEWEIGGVDRLLWMLDDSSAFQENQRRHIRSIEFFHNSIG